jgi:hypothetical protein
MNNTIVFRKLIVAALLFFIINLMIFKFSELKDASANFYYSIPIIHLLFFLFSIAILLVVLKISKKNFDNTGMVFILVTTVKMFFSFLLAQPILSLEENKIEKINFFIVFSIYLIMETKITITILNKNYQKKTST